MTEATPRPWRWEGAALLGKGQKGAAFDDCVLRTLGNCNPLPDDEALIVRAVNRDAHVAPLMEALERALLYIEERVAFMDKYGAPEFLDSSINCEHWRDETLLKPIRKALAAAKEAAP